MRKELRDYQLDISNKAVEILRDKKLVYLNMEPRCGKTATALETCKLYGAKKVLFATKKIAIGSIQDDYNDFGYTFDLTIINNESLHTITDNDFDVVIQDEAHGMGSFLKSKPNKKAKDFKFRFSKLPIIMLSGTMASESYSQVYHQFWLSSYSPFKEPTFSKWAVHYVDIKMKYLRNGPVKDYSCAKIDLIDEVIQPYILKFTQKQSGFVTKVNEVVIHCPECNKNLIGKLKKDLVIEGKNEVILADTGVKLMMKLHQLESGTIKFESGNSMILDESKAVFIREHFKGKKLAIFYYYKEEFLLLQVTFPNYTTDIEEFNTTDKHYIGQQYSSAMGVNLSSADCLIFYNFGFSGTNYIQSIDRLTTKDRKVNDVYFVYGKGSLTESVHKVVKNKKTFTLKQFEKC